MFENGAYCQGCRTRFSGTEMCANPACSYYQAKNSLAGFQRRRRSPDIKAIFNNKGQMIREPLLAGAPSNVIGSGSNFQSFKSPFSQKKSFIPARSLTPVNFAPWHEYRGKVIQCARCNDNTLGYGGRCQCDSNLCARCYSYMEATNEYACQHCFV